MMYKSRTGLFTLLLVGALGLVFLTTSSVPAAAPVDTISYWKLDETTPGTYTDSVGNNDGASTLYIDNVKLTSHNTSYVDVLTDQTVAGVKTFTDPLIVQESVPTIKMVQTTAGTDQGKWLFLATLKITQPASSQIRFDFAF